MSQPLTSVVIAEGHEWGKWVYVSDAPKCPRSGARRVVCRCKCGRSERTVELSTLRQGYTRQCKLCQEERTKFAFGAIKRTAFNAAVVPFSKNRGDR